MFVETRCPSLIKNSFVRSFVLSVLLPCSVDVCPNTPSCFITMFCGCLSKHIVLFYYPVLWMFVQTHCPVLLTCSVDVCRNTLSCFITTDVSSVHACIVQFKIGIYAREKVICVQTSLSEVFPNVDFETFPMFV